jgi:hypothetical protein
MGVARPDRIIESMQTQRYNKAIEPVQSGPVKIKITQSTEDHGMVEMWLDYEKAQVPSRAYFADYVDVIEGRADITLVFGRLKPGTSRLRSQVEISFARESMVTQVWQSARELHAVLQKGKKQELPPIEGLEPSELVHTSRANNVFMAVMGEEAILDFYYIAPSDIHFVKLGRRDNVNLEPVIRVSAPSPLVLEFLDKCGEVVAKIPKAEAIIRREEEDK